MCKNVQGKNTEFYKKKRRKKNVIPKSSHIGFGIFQPLLYFPVIPVKWFGNVDLSHWFCTQTFEIISDTSGKYDKMWEMCQPWAIWYFLDKSQIHTCTCKLIMSLLTRWWLNIFPSILRQGSMGNVCDRKSNRLQRVKVFWPMHVILTSLLP